MQARVTRYLNEIVSLTVMMLMAVALVAGEAGKPAGAPADRPMLVAEHDFSFRHDGE